MPATVHQLWNTWKYPSCWTIHQYRQRIDKIGTGSLMYTHTCPVLMSSLPFTSYFLKNTNENFQKIAFLMHSSHKFTPKGWQDLHDDDKTWMQSSYWELILENGQWPGCWITDGLCALPVTGWTGIHGFEYFSPLIRIAPFSVHKLIRQDTAVLHQAIIV
jgi:hypothetical protein